MNTSDLKERIKKLPAQPGIYIFKNLKNKPLYIGKALNLKNRLKSYLKTNSPRLQQMILETNRINFIETDNDIEALILESQYIKKYRPDFNIMLRDDKQYGFVGFTQEKFPKIFITHQPTQFRNSNLETRNKSQILNSEFKTVSDLGFRASDFQYIGPFTDLGALKITLRLLRRIFPYCTCKQTHHNYCLNYHIGKCPGFCCLKQQNPNLKLKNQNEKLYRNNIKAIKKILSGKQSSLIKNLEKEMKTLSRKQEFEKALELQYKIEKIKRVFENVRIIQHQKTDNISILKELQNILELPNLPHRIEAYDIANIQGKYAVGVMVVFTDGLPNKNEYRKFKIYTGNTPNDTAMLSEILVRRLKHSEWPMPNLILVDGGRAQFNTAESSVKNIPMIALTKNDKHIGHKVLTNKTREISLSKLHINVKNLLLQINSEAHRFAISYYRKLHQINLKFMA